jgi:hypothetical protein
LLGVTVDDDAYYFRSDPCLKVREYPVDDGEVDLTDYELVTAGSLEGKVNAEEWRFINRLIRDRLDEDRIRYNLDDLEVDYS